MSNRNDIWKDKRVFLTGHTGFKGGWLALWLTHLGAQVRGYSLAPCTRPSFFEEARIGDIVDDIRGDIRDGIQIESSIKDFSPDVVFHLAAQPLVRASYLDPITTYETNVLGTARVLEAVRKTPSVRAVVSVTTDKCYENKEWAWGYRETDSLGGYDPYSSSKACAEIVSAAFRQSYWPLERFSDHRVAIATARAGNVIGGGDWSVDRLIPDLIQGFSTGTPVIIRNPNSIRPWQHVLEPLHGYILLAEKLMGAEGANFAKAYNFGPLDDDARPVNWIVERLASEWGDGASWRVNENRDLHEANFLKLDASRARYELGWFPNLRLSEALTWLVDWYKKQLLRENMATFSLGQIDEYQSRIGPRLASL